MCREVLVCAREVLKGSLHESVQNNPLRSSSYDCATLQLSPTATTIALEYKSEFGGDEGHTNDPCLWRRCSRTSQSIGTRVARILMSIAMIIANEYLDRDESRERASSYATRVAMNYCMFDRDEDRNEQLKSSYARVNKTQCKKTCMVGSMRSTRRMFARAN